jgi:hypothetical protein
MKANVSLLIPFDLGLELDFVGKDAKEIVKEVSRRSAADLSFDGRTFSDVHLTAQLYKFGVMMIELSFSMEGEMSDFARLSCQTDSINVGKSTLDAWARSLVDGLVARARKFASYTYERRLDEGDVFPIFVFEKGILAEVQPFMDAHHKALYGIVAGGAHYDALSSFVLSQEKLVNFGYYENDLILIKRFGAVVASDEWRTILDLIRLAYALHWSLRAYSFLLDFEIDQAQRLLSHLPPYYKFWAMPRRYQVFSREAIGFAQDKLSIVDSLYNVSSNIPPVESDWHLRTIYKNVGGEFDVDNLSKEVEAKLDRVQQAYDSARELLATNFFIAVEIVLILSLAWMVLDTSLLFIIARK